MALPFLNGQSKKKRDQIIAVDLGGRSTKAVHMQRKGDIFSIHRFCVMDAPIYEKTLSVDMLADHLKAICLSLEAKTKYVSLSISVSDSMIRHAEMPEIPVADMRQILKNNSKNYLQQELPGYTFDCYFIPYKLNGSKPGQGQHGKVSHATSQKLKVLVGGTKSQLANDLQAAVKQAGLVPDQVMPGIVGPTNAFELTFPEIFENDAIALVDIGFKNTSICLLNKGELILSRVVNIGGDRLTQGLAESMGISYAEAEGIKVGMPAEVKATLEPLLTPLGRELRASVDFFEHQQDRTVSQIYISGGSARSEFIVKSLETELMVPCTSWNPTSKLQLTLPPAQVPEIEQMAPQLTVAIGTAAAAF
jgi:type IV pilus assembly protein PilM